MGRYFLILVIFTMIFFAGCVQADVSNFEECVDAGYPIEESFPQKCSDGENTFVEELDYQSLCTKNDGKYLDEFNECEGMPEDTCEELGGEFVACGSACRHQSEAQFCTTQCVPYCDFN